MRKAVARTNQPTEWAFAFALYPLRRSTSYITT